MVQKENFEKHDVRAMSSSVQIRKKPFALADGVVTLFWQEDSFQ